MNVLINDYDCKICEKSVTKYELWELKNCENSSSDEISEMIFSHFWIATNGNYSSDSRRIWRQRNTEEILKEERTQLYIRTDG